MTGEYGVECRMEPLGYSLARWVGGGWDAIEKADKVIITYICFLTNCFTDDIRVQHERWSRCKSYSNLLSKGRKAVRRLCSERSMGEARAALQGDN